MATIIDCGNGRFIAGDPPTELPAGCHWCAGCGGSGLEHDLDGDLSVCAVCWGTCVADCTGGNCEDCAHETRMLRYRRLSALEELCSLAMNRAIECGRWDEYDRLRKRQVRVFDAWLESGKA